MYIDISRSTDESIKVGHSAEPPIDELDRVIQINIGPGIYISLTLAEAEELSDKIDFTIQDYHKVIMGGK